jgi:hypothetical protein
MKCGASCNAPTFILFSIFDVVCCLQIMDFSLHFSQFKLHLVLIDWSFVQLFGLFLSGKCEWVVQGWNFK